MARVVDGETPTTVNAVSPGTTLTPRVRNVFTYAGLDRLLGIV